MLVISVFFLWIYPFGYSIQLWSIRCLIISLKGHKRKFIILQMKGGCAVCTCQANALPYWSKDLRYQVRGMFCEVPLIVLVSFDYFLEISWQWACMHNCIHNSLITQYWKVSCNSQALWFKAYLMIRMMEWGFTQKGHRTVVEKIDIVIHWGPISTGSVPSACNILPPHIEANMVFCASFPITSLFPRVMWALHNCICPHICCSRSGSL